MRKVTHPTNLVPDPKRRATRLRKAAAKRKKANILRERLAHEHRERMRTLAISPVTETVLRAFGGGDLGVGIRMAAVLVAKHNLYGRHDIVAPHETLPWA